MFELATFYDFCKEYNVDVIPYLGCPQPGATVRDGGYYGVFLDFSKIPSTRMLKGICCHEMGHAATGALHKVDSSYELVERSEYRATRWTAQHILTAEAFSAAFQAGYTQLWQLAEYFDLPEPDIQKALDYWTVSRGIDFHSLAEKATYDQP